MVCCGFGSHLKVMNGFVVKIYFNLKSEILSKHCPESNFPQNPPGNFYLYFSKLGDLPFELKFCPAYKISKDEFSQR